MIFVCVFVFIVVVVIIFIALVVDATVFLIYYFVIYKGMQALVMFYMQT